MTLCFYLPSFPFELGGLGISKRVPKQKLKVLPGSDCSTSMDSISHHIIRTTGMSSLSARTPRTRRY